jgi:hypothetical protein
MNQAKYIGMDVHQATISVAEFPYLLAGEGPSQPICAFASRARA